MDLTKKLKNLLALNQEIHERRAELDDLERDMETATHAVFDYLPDSPYIDPFLFEDGWIVQRVLVMGEKEIQFHEYRTPEDVSVETKVV